MTNRDNVSALATPPSSRQKLFVRYTLAILIDLVVLGLFNQFWGRVHIETFSIALMAAALMQLLLQATFKIEHYVSDYFKTKSGALAKCGYVGSVWFVLFISKFIMLGAIEALFSGQVHFDGRFHGAVPFIVVVTVMIAAEELVVRIYRRLGDKPAQ
ncbi:hypothetical protein [Gilvimarinus algae]|uniref:Uncharacterized protein n=1 Tax=Gilvimarinus algae TaxID=3058037 RepID=A0ABT8TBQ6_9GAMM|nr:hypothetical protein [Gilvimarinus sp. SDUM040014]MDO3381532.1 hypothetical protein [Gilvimarinus sp. SDUM040014]